MSTATATPTTDTAAPAKAKSKKKLIIIVALVLVVAGAAYWFMLKPKAPPGPPEPGEVVTLEPVQVNLAAGHYLRVGIALQLTTSAHEADGSKALDATIELFSGREMSELATAKERTALKKELEQELEEAYHGDVMGVYFTQFVTQ